MAYIAAALYNIALLAGTAYLVLVHEWSAWWFLATACFFVQVKGNK